MVQTKPCGIKALLSRHGLRIALPLLLLVLAYTSHRITSLPTAVAHPGLELSTRCLLPAVTALSVVLSALRRYASSFSLFIGYHVGAFLALSSANDANAFLLTVLLTLGCSVVMGVWLELLPFLFSRWRKESDPHL